MNLPHSADFMDFCPVCKKPSVIVDTSVEESGSPDVPEFYSVIFLDCGHQIVNKLQGAALRNYTRSCIV